VLSWNAEAIKQKKGKLTPITLYDL